MYVFFTFYFRGQSSVVLKPKSTEEVSKILTHCNKRRSVEKLCVCRPELVWL